LDLNLSSLADLLPASWVHRRLLVPRYPRVALEVRTDGLAAVRLQRVKGKLTLAGHALRSLPADVVGSSLFRPDLADPARLEFELRAALETVQAKGVTRISLALPDSLAKVMIIQLPEMPRRISQTREMVNWKVRRTLPFRSEDAVLSYQMLPSNAAEGCRVLVSVALRKVVQQYERVFQDMGIRIGLVDLASLNVYNALRAAIAATVPAGSDHAILNATENSFTLMIFRGEVLLFFRCKHYHVGGGYQGEESLRVVQRELRSSLTYHQEKLGGQEITHAFVRGVGLDLDGLMALLPGTGLSAIEIADAPPSLAGLDKLEPPVTQALLPAIGMALGRSG
jgi:hypothetical protein